MPIEFRQGARVRRISRLFKGGAPGVLFFFGDNGESYRLPRAAVRFPSKILSAVVTRFGNVRRSPSANKLPPNDGPFTVRNSRRGLTIAQLAGHLYVDVPETNVVFEIPFRRFTTNAPSTFFGLSAELFVHDLYRTIGFDKTNDRCKLYFYAAY